MSTKRRRRSPGLVSAASVARRDCYTRQSNSTRCRRIAISRSRRMAGSLSFPPGLDGAPGGSGLMTTRCSTALTAARLRSTLHDPHASRTRSDGGISLMTVADPDSRSYSRRALADAVFGALPDIEPVDPVNHPAGQVTARIGPHVLRTLDPGQQFRAARRRLVLAAPAAPLARAGIPAHPAPRRSRTPPAVRL